MSEALDELFLFGEDKMEKALNQLKHDFGAIRSGRANPMILDKVVVEYYGAPTPLRQMSQVTVQDGTTLVISPFDKSIIKDIEKAIIILHLEEHSYREIGEIIGISEGNAGVRLNRIKNQLIKILANGKY